MTNWQDTYEKLKKRKKIIDEVSSPKEIKTIDKVNNYSLPVKAGRVNNLSSVNNVEKVSNTLLGFNNIKRVTTFNSPSLLDDDSPFNTNIKTTVNTTNDDKKKEVKTEKKEVKQTKEDKKIAKFYQAKDYSTYSDEELKKEKNKLEKELVNQIKKLNKTAWWDKDDNIIENVGNVLYKSFLERDPNVHDDEYYKYKAIEKQLKDIKDITENRYVANKKLDTVDKIGYTFGGNIETGFKGVESTALKILGQEEQINPDLSVREKLASKSREESSGAGQVGLDILGSVGRMTPQIMVGNPVGATAVGFANYGGGAYNEAKRDGYSEEQATKYGITVGAMEMATEKVLGAFGDVYGTTKAGKVSQSVIDKVIPKIISNKQVRNVMNQFIAEGSEEFLQEYLGNIAKDTLLDEKGFLKSTYQNITDTDVLSDALYSAFVGGLTGGVMSVPGQVDAYRYEKATGRSAETGLTTNEQSVVDNVVSERQTELQKKKAVDNEVNKTIKNLESTYGTLTNAEKKGIRKDIQAKLDNGEIDFSTSKLSKKEISNIEKQVKDDLQKGYISTDSIEKALGTDADLSLDAYLQRSYNEKSLRSKQFTYQASNNDSEFRKELAKTTDVLNDTTRSHELFETVSKISEDTGTKYGFVNNEKLKSLGHDVEGKTINGLVRVNEDGTSKVLINVDSDKALNTIIGHETTHLLEGTKEYQSLQNVVKEYAKNKGDYDSKYNQVNSLYQGTNANVDNEVTSDLVGDYLFTDEDFIKNLSAKEPTVFQKVYDYIKHVYNLATAGSKEQRELEKVKYRFEQAYNEMSKTTTQQAETNLTTEAESNTTKYHISEKFSEDIDDMVRDIKRTMEQDVIGDQYIDELIDNSDSYREDDNGNTNYDEVRDALMEALEKEGISGRYDKGKDKYIYDRQELAKKGYDELLNYLDKNNVNYEVSRSTEAGYVPSIYIKNAEGETIYRIANHDNGYVDDLDMVYNGAYNTLYSDKDYANWKERILPKIEKEIGSLEKQSTKYSLSDNQGRTLSKEQQEYFKDSKVRDEEGKLVTVYHTMTENSEQFNEFNPVGTDYYRFGDQVVNYYTDSKDMSGSYANQRYKMADTYAPKTIDEVNELINNFNNNINSNEKYDYLFKLSKKDDGSYRLAIKSQDKFIGQQIGEITSWKETRTYKNEKEMLKNVYGDMKAYKVIRDENGRIIYNTNNYQYEGYINITNPYVVNAEGKNWNNVSRRIEDKKLNVIKSLTDKQKTELNKLALESEKLHDNYLQNDSRDFYLLQNAYSDLPGDVQYEIDVMYRLTGDLKNADSKIAVWGKDQSLREITLKQFAKEYTEAVDKREKYKYPMTYFKSKYQDIANYGEIEAEELYNVALSNFNFSDKEYEKRFSKANSTNDVVKQVIDMNKNGSKYDGVIFKNVYDYGSYSGENEQTPNDVYVTFNSNQFKAVDNTNPTSDADIRFSLAPEYGMSHRPSTDYGDASNFEENMPDVFEHPEWYMFGGSPEYKKAYKESLEALRKVRNNPNGEITIYRATIGDNFNEGDWVSPSKAYAEWHNYSNLEGKGKVIELKVKAKDIRFAGDDINEFGYFPNGVDDYSLSRFNEQRKAYGNYNIFGEDVRLQQDNQVQQQVQEAIAPLQEQVKVLSDQLTTLTENIAPVSQDIVERENMNNFNTLTDENAPTNLSDEEARELGRLNSLPFDLEGEEQSRVDELTRKQDEYGSFTFDNETPEVKNKSVIIKDLKDFGMSQQEARNLYNKIANDSTTTPEDIFNELKNYRDIYEDNEYYKEIRNDIKGTRLNISNIKDQITDYGNSYRMSLMGKKLILGNSGQSIDSFYQELSSKYPYVFSPEITAEVDQLNTIADFLYKDDKMLVDRLSDEEITELADKIYNEIDITERLKNTRETLYSNSNFKNLVSLLEAGEITPETYEDFLKSLPNELSEDYAPYLEFARELNASSTDKTRQKGRIRSLLDEKSIKVQETTNEPTISSNNPFNELLDKFLKRKRTKPDVAPKVEKSKLRNLTDTVKELTINRNVEIDNLAKESGNLNIKYAGDMLNSVAGEVGGDIYTAQTDNEGHAIGKSVSGLFQEVKKEGLYDAFNDYLEQYSNIDRHKQGKGSQTPLDVSQELVKEYESRYPRFIGLAKDVWNYGANVRANMVDSGLITQEFADTLKEMYPHYVPFMENREMTNTYQDIGEAKPKSVIKRAKGGAKNILPIEEALTKYTYAYKKAIRQNQLYQEIVKTLNDKVEIGADVRSDPTDLNESLYRDEKGNYLTAYVDGQQESVRISDDLYRGLKNDMESKVRDIEQRLSLITTPLQKANEVRRNLLTTWSPTFIITNPIKDIQDAVFNSKHTMSMLKNYPTSFIELSQAKSETAKQFLTLYGSGNVQGDYSVDSGLNKGVVQKNAKFLKGISKINDIVELAPRYAEFKASLENGATIQEAMYNAREITTNFNRGGVITKALNRNGATFLNASVQGFDKFVRNFSGENGAKGVVGSLLKASLFGVLPAVFNEMAFGGDDDDKDEDYEALPNYIKDNYYLIKTENGDFIRIPKGRMLSVFGSTARRTLEYMQGNEDAFEGYLENAWTQVGFNNPEENNLLTPIKQAINNEAWYGGDLVPSRLQKLAPKEQYDASTDNFSIWLGDKLNISPYKINYVLDQYTGGIGDMLLPLITEEAQTDSDSIPDMMLAPIRDKFVVNSTSDNKYASDLYTLTDKMDKVTSDIKATDEYKIQDSYLYSITSEMAELYQERRDAQANKNLSKSEKYKKVQSIQEQINSLAKEGLDNYNNVEKTDNYAIVGGREFNKYTTDDGEERWGRPREDELNDLNSMGMTLQEKSSYYRAKTDISSIKDEYKGSKDYTGQKREIIATIKDSGLNDEQKSYLYDKYYASSETLEVVKAIGIDFDSYLDYEYQNFTADKDADGKSISGSKKQKVFDYINSMDIGFEEKVILAKLQYNTYDEYNYDIIDYLNNNDDISYDQEVAILKKLGFKVDDEGNIYW